MAPDDGEMANPQGRRRLDIIDLAQLQRLPAQQPAQPGPTGDTQDQTEEEQAQIGAFDQACEVLGVVAHVDLKHQDGGGDQQHAGDRVQRGVKILDDIVHPTPEIAGRDAQKDGGRQHHQGRERADQQAGADALEGLKEDVLAHLVGAENVIFARQLGGGKPEHQQETEHRQRGAPGDRGSSRQDIRPDRRHRLAAPARDPPEDAGTDQPAGHEPLQNPDQRPESDVEATLARGIGQMSSAVFQSGIGAGQRPIGLLDRLLDEEMGREGCRIALFLTLAQSAQGQIEQAQHLGRVP